VAGAISTASPSRSITLDSVAEGTAREVLWPPDKQDAGNLGRHSGPFERPMNEDLKKKLEELGQRETRLRTQLRELDSMKRE